MKFSHLKVSSNRCYVNGERNIIQYYKKVSTRFDAVIIIIIILCNSMNWL